MITKCILIYALLVNNFGFSVADKVMDLTDCDNYIPETCYQYATLLIEHFDEKNIETAKSLDIIVSYPLIIIWILLINLSKKNRANKIALFFI